MDEQSCETAIRFEPFLAEGCWISQKGKCYWYRAEWSNLSTRSFPKSIVLPRIYIQPQQPSPLRVLENPSKNKLSSTTKNIVKFSSGCWTSLVILNRSRHTRRQMSSMSGWLTWLCELGTFLLTALYCLVVLHDVSTKRENRWSSSNWHLGPQRMSCL